MSMCEETYLIRCYKSSSEYYFQLKPSSFYVQYIDAARSGDLATFKKVEAATTAFWFPLLDRGNGPVLHFAIDHGRLDIIKYLVEHHKVEVNQQDVSRGLTALHRCARVAHYKHRPFLEIFEFLLQHGADPDILSFPDKGKGNTKRLTVLDVVVEQGYGWEKGEVRDRLSALVLKYGSSSSSSCSAKPAAYVYQGPPMREEAMRVLKIWESLPALYPVDEEEWEEAHGGMAMMGMRPLTA